ncbi:MAG TPA: enoyl-CoA hydratase family protein [Pseudonocardia sp.]|jgi:enoyl-CoA hydratase|nr:enoyl-CoA hydratase family protein [Pseudonocardia sp.]
MPGHAVADADELVHLTVEHGVATITLDSPHNRNALSRRLTGELTAQLTAALADEAVRAIVLAHTGPAFCAGADLSEASGNDLEAMQAATRSLLSLLRTIVEAPKPVVALVRGAVRAGGTGIVGACDIALVSDAVTFAFTEVRLGLAIAVISLPLLPRLEPRAASRYILTGESFAAAEAVRIGLVTAAVPPDGLEAALQEVLTGLRAGSPQGLAESKKMVTRDVRREFQEHGEEMVGLSARLFSSAEAQEGMRSFLERRPPRWDR